MSDLRTDPVSIVLSARISEVARAVADVLEVFSGTDSHTADLTSFLRRWADSVGGDVQPGPTPFDRLAAQYDLTAEECDLLVLAGLAWDLGAASRL